jgi:hypothetical protein
MDRKVFISYRRADSKAYAGRIYDRLVEQFGKEGIFKDVDSIPAGHDFRAVLSKAVDECDILLSLIGPTWATAKSADGSLRLMDPDDFVRIEIETALSHNDTLVIPVLLDNTPMPSPDQLPESLAALPFRNAIKVRDDPDFHADMQRVIEQICTHLQLSVPAEHKQKVPETKTYKFPTGITPQSIVNEQDHMLAGFFEYPIDELVLNRQGKLSDRQIELTQPGKMARYTGQLFRLGALGAAAAAFASLAIYSIATDTQHDLTAVIFLVIFVFSTAATVGGAAISFLAFRRYGEKSKNPYVKSVYGKLRREPRGSCFKIGEHSLEVTSHTWKQKAQWEDLEKRYHGNYVVYYSEQKLLTVETVDVQVSLPPESQTDRPANILTRLLGLD